VLAVSWCGRIASKLTDDADAVTCKSCIRLAARLVEVEDAKKPRSVTLEELVLSFARALAGPPIRPYPPLTPALYRTMRCRMGSGHCSCAFCQIDEGNINPLAAWTEEQQERPHRSYDCDFGSINAALTFAARWRREGPTARASAHGGMMSRAQETMRLGTQVQVTHRSDREALEIRRVAQVHDILRAVEYAFAEQAERRGLPLETCVDVVLAAFDEPAPLQPEEWAEATGLTPRALRELWLHGRRVAQERLALGEYVPTPRTRVRRLAKGDRWIAERWGV
jgi:hypothetical protein